MVVYIVQYLYTCKLQRVQRSITKVFPMHVFCKVNDISTGGGLNLAKHYLLLKLFGWANPQKCHYEATQT